MSNYMPGFLATTLKITGGLTIGFAGLLYYFQCRLIYPANLPR